MSQLFDRFGRIIRSIITPADEQPASMDGDMREAWEELESFLNGPSEPAAHKADQRVVPEELRASYTLLKIPFGAPSDQVQFAYKQLLRQNHPDHNPDPAAADKTREIIAAFRRIRAWETRSA